MPVFAAILLGSCAPLPGDRLAITEAGTYEISEIGHGSPPIVFEAGLGAYKESWNKIVPTVAENCAVFAYDRPGVGHSEPTARPRHGTIIVEDLRRLLRERGVARPYVLVGHSAGGLYMQLFARLHPDEVAGLVLVDPTHPTQFEGDGALEHRGLLAVGLASLVMTGAMKEEFDGLEETGREVLAAPSLSADIPIIILIAPDKSGTPIADFDNAKRADFARLYPSAIVREVDGGHDVPQTNPQVVIDAIADVVRKAQRH
jgi:pimeloyl-ACP methyl ester carboxylesterase